MGLDIYFYDGVGEDAREIEIESHLQITHNLNTILLELDKINSGETNYYELIWRPDELFGYDNGSVPVKDVLLFLPDVISSVVLYQERLKQYLPENGYGSFEWLYKFLCDYLKECCLHQNAYIYCCR